MATDLSDLLVPELIVVGMTAASKKTLFAQLGTLVAPALGIDGRVVAEALTTREKEGSTGFGGGVAIPHARIAGLRRVALAVARLTHPLDYGAVDDAPVDVVAAMFSPPQAGGEHLKALARVARRLRDRPLVAKLRGAGSPDAIYALLTDHGVRDAA
ncbi:PTS system nitrogen regulatory IIA component [Sphingomonas sp. BE138]|uniref:PTS sugar transporter subunit IIA n=1 Tax=Sphingomonas sp. BE138 TaxID=2817845 RepID=UPI00285C834E|nr:PTS sugar transporter subunit IIA [Sphingomonas sp. BE138]MDR6789069.1 PTS system nitrogen regulatory IIA component [Sphingomonas sp. BE138]